MRKHIKAGAAKKDADEFYQADQEAEDYNALSTEDDSEAAQSDTAGVAAGNAEAIDESKAKKDKGTAAQVSAIQRSHINLMNKFCEWPACYSLLITCTASYALIHFDTSVGAKISSFSRTQILLILLVICIVSKNVFIPSRANRFIENSNISTDA